MGLKLYAVSACYVRKCLNYEDCGHCHAGAVSSWLVSLTNIFWCIGHIFSYPLNQLVYNMSKKDIVSVGRGVPLTVA